MTPDERSTSRLLEQGLNHTRLRRIQKAKGDYGMDLHRYMAVRKSSKMRRIDLFAAIGRPGEVGSHWFTRIELYAGLRHHGGFAQVL